MVCEEAIIPIPTGRSGVLPALVDTVWRSTGMHCHAPVTLWVSSEFWNCLGTPKSLYWTNRSTLVHERTLIWAHSLSGVEFSAYFAMSIHAAGRWFTASVWMYSRSAN